MSFTVIIPARFESTRLPRKPLIDILGKPMVQWTWSQAKKSGASRVIIATESDDVEYAAAKFDAEVCMTSNQHQSGTERIAEVIELMQIPDDEIIVNVQGDEPMLPPELIEQVATGLKDDAEVQMATLCEPIDSVETVFDPHAVKVIRDKYNHAMNFTRAPMPWSRDTFVRPAHLPENYQYQRHIGLYAYYAGFVKQYVSWAPCALEDVEKLEQLRVLWQGQKILVLDALMDAGVGVDTIKDAERVRELMRQTPDTF